MTEVETNKTILEKAAWIRGSQDRASLTATGIGQNINNFIELEVPIGYIKSYCSGMAGDEQNSAGNEFVVFVNRLEELARDKAPF